MATDDNVINHQFAISAFGIPCLDYVVKLTNTELLDKYKFASNGQVAVDLITFCSLLEDIKNGNYEVTKCVGGSSQNILRIYQWLAKIPNKTVMFGIAGQDDDAYTMKKHIERDGVISRYETANDSKTFGVIILSMGDTRLCVGINDCKLNYPKAYLDESDKYIVTNSKILHTDGFFVHYNPDFAKNLLNLSLYDEHVVSAGNNNSNCLKKNIRSFNLACSFPIDLNPRLFLTVCTASDILFANKDEFETLTELNGLRTDSLSETVKNFHRLMLIRNNDNNDNNYKRWRKIVIVTDGSNPLHCVYGDDQRCLIYQPTRVDVDAIVDTTGAGDAFAAGFLYGLIEDFDICRCLEIACKTAAVIIRQSGVEIPDIEPSDVVS